MHGHVHGRVPHRAPNEHALGTRRAPLESPRAEAAITSSGRVYIRAVGTASAMPMQTGDPRSGVERRGGSSLNFPKQSFAIEFWSEKYKVRARAHACARARTHREFTQSEKKGVLGMDSAKDWILYARARAHTVISFFSRA